MEEKRIFARYVRSFIFGVEDSLVSTVGLLSGIAIAGTPKETILLAGIVLIFVEGFSMAVGSFLSERSAEEFLSGEESAQTHSVLGGAVMFISYFLAGFIPLSPYLFWESAVALPVSIIFALTALFILGVVSARILKLRSVFRSALRMMLVGGIAVILGVIVGGIVK